MKRNSKLFPVNFTFDEQDIVVWGEVQRPEPDIGVMNPYFEIHYTVPELSEEAYDRLLDDDNLQEVALESPA